MTGKVWVNLGMMTGGVTLYVSTRRPNKMQTHKPNDQIPPRYHILYRHRYFEYTANNTDRALFCVPRISCTI